MNKGLSLIFKLLLLLLLLLSLLLLLLLLLLSNCTKWSTNNVRIQYKYPAILYGYLDSWLFCTERKLFN